MKDLLKSALMKVESSYANDAVPLVSDVILVENLNVNPLQMQTDDYTPVSNRFGQSQKIIGAVWSTVEFDVVVGGGGPALGNVAGLPNHDAVLRSGCMARVITAGSNIVYSPIDSGEESVTLAYTVDAGNFRVLGLRGNLKWSFAAGKATRMRFNGLGLRVPMTDFSLAPYPLPTKPRPLAMTNANSQFLLNGTYALRCEEFGIDLGNKIEYINRAGQEEVILADRASSGSVMFELPSVAQQDFLGANGWCTRATPTSIVVQFGSTAGNRVSWSLSAAQLLNPRLSGNKGTTMLTCDLHVVENAISLAYF